MNELFIRWLAHTPMSLGLQSQAWIIPALQTLHILAFGVTISIALLSLFDLTRTPPSALEGAIQVSLRTAIVYFVPIVVASGLLLVIAEPGRSLGNRIFFIKMALFAGALGMTMVHSKLYGATQSFVTSRGLRVARRGSAVLLMTLWIGVVFAGRFIAYF